MDKTCVFCGEKPISKNMEHVLPKWLFTYTGGFNRKISIKIPLKKEKIEIDILNFKFPACERCNNSFLDIESKTKDIICRLNNKEKISSSDFEILFNWLDKVRIGLWLGSLMFSGNPQKIKPKFAISNRFKKDRILYISHVDGDEKRLNFSSFDDILFQNMPCYLCLIINNICLLSFSTDSLLLDRIPLPNLKIKKLNNREGLFTYSKYCLDVKKVNLPYLGKKHFLLFQVNYPFDINNNFKDNSNHYISNSTSKILMNKSKKMLVYPDNASNIWVAEKYDSYREFLKENNNKYIFLRNWLIDEILKILPNKNLLKLHLILKNRRT